MAPHVTARLGSLHDHYIAPSVSRGPSLIK